MSEVWIAEKRNGKVVEEEEKKGTSQAKVSELHKESSRVLEKATLLNIPLKGVMSIKVPDSLTPHINVVPSIFVKIGVTGARAPQSSILSCNLKVLRKLPREIRVQVYEPLNIIELTCPSLNLKLKPPENWSIRPSLEPLVITDLGSLNPRLRCEPKPIGGLEILPTPYVKNDEICTPKIRVTQTYFTMEEIRRVVYKLWLMRFDEGFIVECINRTYGKILSLNEVRKIVAEGEKGYVEIIGMLPAYVNESIDAIIAEKGGVYLRGTQTELTLPLEEIQRPRTQSGDVGVESVSKLLPEDAEPVYELIFEEKSGKGVGGAVTYSGETVYIVFQKPFSHEYECKDTLHYLCLRSLREYVGEAKTRAISGEYGKDEVERYLGEKGITIIDEEKLKEKGLFKETAQGLILEIKEEALADRLRSFAEGFKFVIFYVAPKESRILYEKLWKLRSKFHDKIFWITPKQTITLENVVKISKLIWAFVDIPGVGNYDDLFGYGKNVYYGKLEDVREAVMHGLEKPYPIVKTHRLGHESREHYLLKCFVAKSFVDKPPEEMVLSRVPKERRYEKIKFEYEFEPSKIIADAYIEDDKIAIEVETLFEEGAFGGEPIAKIRDETVEKYLKHEIPINKLWILMENVTVARHLRELLMLRDLYKRRREKEEMRFSVDFFTLDLKNERLMPIEEFAHFLYDIKMSLNPTTDKE